MPKRRHQTRTRAKPFHAVMVPIIPQIQMDDITYFSSLKDGKKIKEFGLKTSEMVPGHRDVVEHAQHSVKARAKQNKDAQVFKKVLYLGSSEKGRALTDVIDLLSNQGGTLYIVAHGNQETIGTTTGYGIKPEELADLLYYQLGDDITKLQKIVFLTCNSGYHHEGASQSYAGRFSEAMRKEYGADGLTVLGYIGYLSEDGSYRHTYVSAENGSYKNKKRCETQCVEIKPDGTIVMPKNPIKPVIAGTSQDRDLIYKYLQNNLFSASDSSSSRASTTETLSPSSLKALDMVRPSK